MSNLKWCILCALWVVFTFAHAKKCEKRFRSNNEEWMSFEQAETHIQAQNISSVVAFNTWKRQGLRPANFPAHPERTYREDWISWGDFLGTGNIATQKRKWMSFSKAKAYIQTQGIQSAEELRIWDKKGLRPKNFPVRPDRTYREDWGFLGGFLRNREYFHPRKRMDEL